MRSLFGMLVVGMAAALPACVTAESRDDRPRGDYLETRTCDVYTGPCFANGQMALTGKQAILAWNVESGRHQGVDLAGLKVVLCVSGQRGLTADEPDTKSVVLVDEQADAAQREALVNFAVERAGKLAGQVTRVESLAIELSVDHADMQATLSAGDEAAISTRRLKTGDCVCSNEIVFYPPLSEVENFEPAYTVESSFSGRGLKGAWSNPGTRSAFLATFGY